MARKYRDITITTAGAARQKELQECSPSRNFEKN